jgi:hypothetical protein
MPLIQIDDTTIYDAPRMAIPRRRDEIEHVGVTGRVTAITSRLDGTQEAGVTVQFLVVRQPLTFSL